MVILSKHNLHWREGFFYDFKQQRRYFAVILRYLPKKQIIALTGLRRVGKTVLLKQCINYLIEQKHVARKNVLYFSFDEERPHLDTLFQEYTAITGVATHKEPLFIFLDEIQKLPQWQEQIKVYYDTYPHLKFFVSGSESLFIRKKSQESLAGRIYILDIPILTFSEFLLFTSQEDLVKNPLMFKDEIKKKLRVYMSRNFIEVLHEDQASVNEYSESILNKIIYEDLPLLYPIEYPEKLKSLVRGIYSSPGMIITYEHLSRDIGISSKTLEKYLFYLSQAKLIKKLYNFSRNFLTSEKKLKKFYVTAPCFCFLNDHYDVSKIVENFVALHHDIRFFWRDPFQHEVDCIMEHDRQPVALEVKYTTMITPRDCKGLLTFLDKFTVKEGIIITNDYEAEERIDTKHIRCIPLWKWLLD